MKSVLNKLLGYFFLFLEKFSRFLDSAANKRTRRYAFIICVIQIIVCLGACAALVVFMIIEFIKQPILEIRVIMVVALLAVLSFLGSYAYMLITKDLRQIRGWNSNKKEDLAKKNKIEF